MRCCHFVLMGSLAALFFSATEVSAAEEPVKLAVLDPAKQQPAAPVAAATHGEVNFSRDIQPLLSDRCFLCHGPDEKSREADLRLDRRESATEWAIVPGDAEASEVIARITSDDPSLRMPPAESHKRALKPAEIAKLTQWINEGAKYESHWAFVPPVRAELPETRLEAWKASPIDRFVLAKLDELGWEPSPRADKRTLIRRAAFDLTGLPPTDDQIQQFLADESPEAWSKALDRLLATSAFGEHQARHWLDAARYADSNGYQYDFQRDQWAWRDWVINAFNTNMPFDQFTIEQLAGDLLPGATDQQRLATGFNRNHPITVEGGIIDEEYRVEYVIDRTTTTGTVWLGMTIGCARCHDHKYDPVSQKEFFQLTAFFNQVPEKGMQGFDPQASIPSPLQIPGIEAARAEVAEAELEFREAIDRWNPNFALLEEQARRDSGEGWKVWKPNSVSSSEKTKFKTQKDDSVLATGENPERDVYTITLPNLGKPIYGIRLTALPDDSLSTGGTGRSKNGNFVLSEIEVEASKDKASNQFEKVKLAAAKADYSQTGYEVLKAIDGKLGNSGWAVYGPAERLHQPRTAVFIPEQPISVTGKGRLRVKLRFESSYAQHQIGRFQLAAATSSELGGVLPVVKALDIPIAQRSEQETLAVESLLAKRFGPKDVQLALAEFKAARKRRDLKLAKVPETMIMKDISEPRGAFVLERGEYDKRREHVDPNTPAALPPMPEDAPRNRLGLARWLTMPDNPLTSRVTVNRFWLELFGVGLAETPEDFGLQSAPPSHPKLLDWLAVDFVETGWDVKRLLKTIMLSQTYQQDSAVTEATYARDPENRLLARGPRMRLDAETIRDTALAVSGLLNRKIGGASVFPYHPKGLWLEVNNRPGFSSAYKQDTGEKLYRRSMYTFWKRTVPPPSMAVFDAPSREYCQVRRSRTNTPLQAFVMLHDPQFVEAARALAELMLISSEETASQIRFGFEASLGRPPSDEEAQLLLETYQERLAMYQAEPAQAKKLLSIGDSPRKAKLPLAEDAAMTTVARLIMNLSEFITKG